MTAIGPIIWRLAQRFRNSGAVKDRPRSDRPKRLTPREERYIRITADRDRFLPNLHMIGPMAVILWKSSMVPHKTFGYKKNDFSSV
jgi:hypothetical protein